MNDKSLVFEMVKYIEKNLEEELKLENIEEFMGYTKFYLLRLFSEEMNCTIHKYIQMRRMTESAKKLVNTDKTIIDISYEANYDSQQAFTFAFKNVYHVTPLNYRRNGVYMPKMEPFAGKVSTNFVCQIYSSMNCKGVAA